MKKIILMIVAVLLSIPCHGDSTDGPTKTGSNRQTVTMTFTASGTTFSSQEVPNLSNLEDYWLSHVLVDNGTTGPTDNCDVDVLVGGTDILGGNGTDIMDNATSDHAVPYGSSGDAQYPVVLGRTMTVVPDAASENAVSGAEVTITLVFDR